jgi:hypothetical protein
VNARHANLPYNAQTVLLDIFGIARKITSCTFIARSIAAFE